MVALRCRSHCRTLGPHVILMESISGSVVRNMHMSKPLEVIFRNSGSALPVPPAARLLPFYGPCLTHLLASPPHSWEWYERKSKPGWICHRNPNGLQVSCHWYQQWQGDQGGIRRENWSVAPPWVCSAETGSQRFLIPDWTDKYPWSLTGSVLHCDDQVVP